jgi:hypothetical protein
LIGKSNKQKGLKSLHTRPNSLTRLRATRRRTLRGHNCHGIPGFTCMSANTSSCSGHLQAAVASFHAKGFNQSSMCWSHMWPPSYQIPMTKTLKRAGQQRKKLYQGSLCLVDASGINRISPTLVTPLFGAGASEKDVMPMHACVNPTP